MGSEIWNSLDFDWSKKGWVANGADFKWEVVYIDGCRGINSQGALITSSVHLAILFMLYVYWMVFDQL